MLPIAIVIAGEPVEATLLRRGGFAELIRAAAGVHPGSFAVLDARDGLQSLAAYRGVIVSGSAASVLERASWMRAAEIRLAEAVHAGVPVLGICFGHQLLAQALGGTVAKNPNGREIGTVRVELLRDDPLLDEGERPFLANMTHCDSVVRLPASATLLARTALEAHAAVRFAPRAWGVQFHPELDAEVLQDYVHARSAAMLEEGLDPERIRAEISEAPGGAKVLQRFVALVS